MRYTERSLSVLEKFTDPVKELLKLVSLFISALAFEPGTLGESVDERIGILAGSFPSAIMGYIILDRTLPILQA